MSAKVEQIKFISPRKEIVVDSQEIGTETFRRIDFFEPMASVLVFCGIDNVARVLIQPRYEKALQDFDAVVFESKDDDNGIPIELDKEGSISVSGEQELSVIRWRYSKGRGHRAERAHFDKEVLVCVSSEDGFVDENKGSLEPLAIK